VRARPVVARWHDRAAMKHPILIALGAGLLVLALAFVAPLWRIATGPEPGTSAADADLPWRVEPAGPGTVTVFGLPLPGATLGDLQRRWGDDAVQVAVMARRGETGALEAYVETFRAGGVTGRLVAAAAADAVTVSGLRERAPREERIDAEATRWHLSPGDRDAVRPVPIVGYTFLPSARLDAATVRLRFGEPAERWALRKGVEQWLYPSIGVAVQIDEEGRDLVQYVAPGDVDARLRAPLEATGARRLDV
jgi:hypothetical protein